MKRLTLTLSKWLAPAAALFALACALLAPAEAGSPRRPRPRAQDDNVRQRAEGADGPEDSVVRGRAVYDETSRPVRRARVILITDGGSGEYATTTDGRGDFVIAGVSAGTYYAFVDAPGVLSPVGFVGSEELSGSSGRPDLGEARRFFDRIEVDGSQDVSVTVRARRGAAISGRVSYADGDPAVNVNVMLMRRSADGRVQKLLTGATFASLAGLRTDDRGMFRLTGMPPGEYVVGVSETVSHGADHISTSTADDGPGPLRAMLTPQLLTTFYPSATSLKEAGVVKVEAGDERAGLDITIPERDLRVVVGFVRARSGGRPVARARVTISRRDDPLASSERLAAYYYENPEDVANVTTTDAEGRWSFREIPDGAYTIHVRPPDEFEEGEAAANLNRNSSVGGANVAPATNANAYAYRPPRRKRSYAPTRRSLDVSGGDVSEFVVEVADGARVTGTVTVEGGSAPRWGHLSLIRLGEPGAPADDLDATSVSFEGSRFAVEGVPAGRFMLRPSISAEGAVTYLKSITWNGKDLMREPLALAEGASAEGVRIVYANNPAKLQVTVRAAAGRRPPPDLIVTLVPLDLSAWSPYARPVFCMAGEAGSCPISATPGEYRVVAIRSPASPAAYEQEVRRRAPNAPRVTLREGETSRVEVDAPDD